MKKGYLLALAAMAMASGMGNTFLMDTNPIPRRKWHPHDPSNPFDIPNESDLPKGFEEAELGFLVPKDAYLYGICLKVRIGPSLKANIKYLDKLTRALEHYLNRTPNDWIRKYGQFHITGPETQKPMELGMACNDQIAGTVTGRLGHGLPVLIVPKGEDSTHTLANLKAQLGREGHDIIILNENDFKPIK